MGAMTDTKSPRQAINDQLSILYWENDGLLRSIAKETDPEERMALRSELAEVRRCIAQEKRWLSELKSEDGGEAELDFQLSRLPKITLTEADYADGEQNAMRGIR